MRTLAIDQGNTKTKWAVFENQNLLFFENSDNLSLPALKRLITSAKVSYVILSSTRHLPKNMQRFFNMHTTYYLLTELLAFPFEIRYGSPNTLGKDRIAAVAGAWSRFPRQNSLIIDAGSCITYDLITREGLYLGGNISPGVHMRLNAMHHFTAKLPHVEPSSRYMAIGSDTVSALQTGAQSGAIHEMTGFVQEYKRKFRKLNILLTGGDAHFFVNRMKTKIFAAPQLVLQGLNEILNYNVQKDS